MASQFIIKRKSYAMPNLLKSAGKLNPTSGLVMDTADNMINKPLEHAAQEAKTYVPEVKNAYAPNQGQGTEVQRQYGLIGTVAGAAKGLGKHIWNNRGTVGSMAGIGAAMSASNYAMNRYQADKADIESGKSNQDGLTTGEKVGAGAAIAGTTAGVGAWTANNHNKAVKTAQDTFTKNTTTLDRISKGVVSKNQAVNDTLSKKATQAITDSKETLGKLNGRTLGLSNKNFKVGRNALLTATALTTAAVMAHKGLKKAKESRDNKSIQPTQAQYSIAAIGRVVKSTLSAGNSNAGKTIGGLLKQNIQSKNWKTLGKAAGQAASVGTQNLVRGVGNMFTLGRADSLVHNVAKGMKANGGNLGAKAGKFLENHKTAAIGVTGATIGGSLYGAADKIGSTAVNKVASLDKKTNNYIKLQNEQLNNPNHD